MENIQALLAKNAKPKFKFHHVGCAVRNMSYALEYYTSIMGFELVSGPYDVLSQNVKVCFLDMGNGCLLELVEGIGSDSPVEKILARPGGGVYHICLQVDNLDETVLELRSKGFLLITRFEQRDNKEFRYVFMLTPDRELFELCELW